MLPRADPSPDSLSPTLEAIVTRYSAKVRWVARDCRLEPDEVDELFQAVRIKLWRLIERGERIAAEKPSYVQQTVMSAAVDLIRKRRSTEVPSSERRHAAAAEPVSPRDAGPDRTAERADLAERIGRALAELSETRRVVLRLYLAGYQIEEMARRLGWTEPKARNLLYRGLAELRQRLRLLGVTPEGDP
jgi:RNA polymerase sigma-70 factor (ECF subfamily)